MFLAGLENSYIKFFVILPLTFLIPLVFVFLYFLLVNLKLLLAMEQTFRSLVYWIESLITFGIVPFLIAFTAGSVFLCCSTSKSKDFVLYIIGLLLLAASILMYVAVLQTEGMEALLPALLSTFLQGAGVGLLIPVACFWFFAALTQKSKKSPKG